jgi:hypothetical protein
MAPPMPCYEVSGFGHFRYDPEIQPVQVQDWPPLWAVVLMDETLGATYTRVLPTAEEARREARRFCTNLLKDQASRRQTIDAAIRIRIHPASPSGASASSRCTTGARPCALWLPKWQLDIDALHQWGVGHGRTQLRNHQRCEIDDPWRALGAERCAAR